MRSRRVCVELIKVISTDDEAEVDKKNYQVDKITYLPNLKGDNNFIKLKVENDIILLTFRLIILCCSTLWPYRDFEHGLFRNTRKGNTFF